MLRLERALMRALNSVIDDNKYYRKALKKKDEETFEIIKKFKSIARSRLNTEEKIDSVNQLANHYLAIYEERTRQSAKPI